MDTSKLLTMFLERGMAMQTFWGFFITVALGTVAFFGAHRRTKLVGQLFAVGFVMFAWVNSQGIYTIAQQRYFLWKQLEVVERWPQVTAAPTAPLVPAASAPTDWDRVIASGIHGKTWEGSYRPEGALLLHAILDLLVLWAIWALVRAKGADEDIAPAQTVPKGGTAKPTKGAGNQ